jgi:hypothetical protein
MSKMAALMAIAIGLSSCGLVDTLVDGFQHVNAVRHDLTASTGMTPAVGFKWHNGRLENVTVTFPRLYQDKPLPELAETVRREVTREFKQTPEDIVLGFSLGSAPARSTAGLDGPRSPL